ncbi:hypothetical protein DTO212C5_1480 [Paecilomyces variotii]|nr:hypothetical protein DTO212C5_1480 [Paecilomyces variotii]
MSTPATVSAASPDNLSSNHSAFKRQASEQLYLTVPSEPDELAFLSAAASINSRCHTPVDRDGSQISASSSPRSSTNWHGPADSLHRRSESPQNINLEFMTPGDEDYFAQWLNDNYIEGDLQNAGLGSKINSGTSQLLSPGLTNDVNTPSDVEDNAAMTEIVNHQTTTLEDGKTRTDSSSGCNAAASSQLAPYSLNMNGAATGETLPVITSPVVTVSAYSRGDSPHADARFRSASISSSLSNQGQRRRRGSEDHAQTLMSPPSLRAEDGSWVPDSATGHAGIDPLSRGDTQIQSPNQVEEQRKIAEKNADIQTWSASVIRPRARSTGNLSHRKDYFDTAPGDLHFDDSHIPGPGILINEPSDDESDVSSEEESSAEDVIPTEEPLRPEPEPEPHQFFRPYPWYDPPRDHRTTASKEHPESSNAAIVEFLKKAKDVETASRVATWGTRRKSDPEVGSLKPAEGSSSKLTVVGERRNSLFKRIPRMGDSSTKRKMSDSHQQRQEPICIGGDNKIHERKGSFTFGIPSPQRKLSVGRSKSPSLNTSSALVAMTGQMAAVGKSTSSDSAFGSLAPRFSRNRSKSDISKTSKFGIIELISGHGGPPVANIRSPTLAAPSHGAAHESIGHNNAEEKKLTLRQRTVTMDFSIQSQTPIPTIEGFRKQVEKLNPRMHPCLIERLAREQVSRYKSLREAKAKHALAVKQNNCNAGNHCFALGGQATLLSPKTNGLDPDTTCSQYQIPGHETSDNESNAVPEGIVASAQFPSGVPLPPVKRLPAEFECTLCFEVRKIMKPSDWTKHVHEDIYPFTCTFPDCPQAKKSFKRKADWVRHENEVHRKLEWWTCSFQDCQHLCYRKNNFIKHLEREHGILGPGARKTAARKASVKDDIDGSDAERDMSGIASSNELWQLVESCRHETTKTPQDEPCRFCGNVCSSWKKLTVHLAKHLEQIAMPVLQILKDVEVPADATAESSVPGSDGQNMDPSMHYRDIGAMASPIPAAVKMEQDVVTGLSQVPTFNNLAYRIESLAAAPVSAYTSQPPTHNHLGNYMQSQTPVFNNTSSSHLNVPGFGTWNSFAGQQEFAYSRGDSVTYPPVSMPGTFSEPNHNPAARSYPPRNSTTQLDTSITVYDPDQPLCASPTDNLCPWPADRQGRVLDPSVSDPMGDMYIQIAGNTQQPFSQ